MPCQNGRVDVVPVRRDATGRLVAVGLIEAPDAQGNLRWSAIGATALPGETVEQVIDRCIKEALGPDAAEQVSTPRPTPTSGGRLPGRRDGARPRPATGEIDEPCAVEVRGKLEPQGASRRFAWFLVTALPAREAMASGQWAILADLLEEQGERGLAERMRLF